MGINSWVEHGNKAIFGDDADVFNPDRWLQEDKEKVAAMTRHWMPVSLSNPIKTPPRDIADFWSLTALVQFGLGSRTCIGRHISMLEISKLIPRLIRDFEMEVCDNGQWPTQNYWFVKPKNFRVTVRPRAGSP